MNLRDALPPLVRLNGWARGAYEDLLDMHDARAAIYHMKQRVILAAIDAGCCTVRLVGMERPCKVCKGTGLYEWHDWNDQDNVDYQDCRRCNNTGKVVLRFAETEIMGTRFHTPRPKAQFLEPLRLDWERYEETDWTPEQPGRKLTRWEVIRDLNELERAVYHPKLLRWNAGWRGSVYNYNLHFGHIHECFVCGGRATGDKFSMKYGQEIYRPGMRWRQSVCDDHARKADRWPRQWPANLLNPHHTRGMWISENPEWPMNTPLPAMADTEVVREWLARRGIVPGLVPPGDMGFGFLADTGEIVDVVAHVRWQGGEVGSVVRVADASSFRYAPSLEDLWISVPAGRLRGWPVKLIAKGVGV